MTKQLSPWRQQFSGLCDRDRLRRLSTRTPDPVSGLALSPDIATTRIDDALKELFVPSEQDIDVMVTALDAATFHIDKAYPDVRAYVEAINAQSIKAAPVEPICLTGLSRTGKSKLADAILRVFPASTRFNLGAPLQLEVPFEPIALTRVEAHVSSPLTSLAPSLPPDALYIRRQSPSGQLVQSRTHISLSEAQDLATRWAYKVGRAQNIIDELQFVATSSAASTRLAQIPLLWSYTGVPLIYIVNFSACHKLFSRPQEERVRILSRPIVLLPLRADSSDWSTFLQAVSTVLKELLVFKLDSAARELNLMTAGVRGFLGTLIKETYRQIREQRRMKVTLDDLKACYASTAFSEQRKDIEAILAQRISGQPKRGGLDLWSPFGPETNGVEVDGRSNGHQRGDEAPRSGRPATRTQKLAKAQDRASASKKNDKPPRRSDRTSSSDPLHNYTEFMNAGRKKR